MTTQTDSSSPFGNSSNNQEKEFSQSFTFRTMQDDLLSPQKKDTVVSSEQPAPVDAMKKTDDISQSKTPVQNVVKDIPKKEILNSAPNPFLDQEAMTVETKKEAVPVRDFIEKEVVPKITTAEKPLEKEVKLVELPQAEVEYQQFNNPWSKIVLVIIILLTIGIAGLGGYYFWLTKKENGVPAAPEPVVENIVPTTPVEEPTAVEIPKEKYSATKPNFLTIDLANLSSEEIQSLLLATIEDLKKSNAIRAYEFTVVDANNNPVAFPIFATAAKLNFSPALLSTLGENFSLFIYNDSGNPRLGLSATIAKTDLFAAELKKQEKNLPSDLSFMFLGVKPETTTGSFKDSSYGGTKARYLNLNAQETLSIDYAVKGSTFILSTSKNTGRAIIDKLSQKEQAAAINNTPIIPTQDGTNIQPIN